MTIRRKLNLAMLAMFGMLLITTAVVVHTVRTISTQALTHARLRELSVFTDGVRAEVFYRMAVARGFGPIRDREDWWPADVLQDVGVRINLSAGDTERVSWTRVRDAIQTLARVPGDDPKVVDLVRDADRQLRKLRRDYDRLVADSVARTADVASSAQDIVVVVALGSALLFAVVTLLIRDWLVKPILALNHAADEIGKGRLDHRVSLDGRDELAQLARRLDVMAHKLAEHQKQLVESRELAAIGELCTNVAHGLRNPLAGMRAGAQLAGRRVNDPQKLGPMLDDIIAEIDRMDQRITQLFEFSRVCRVDRQPTCFEDLIADARAEARGAVEPRHIQLHTQDRTHGITWPIDRQKLASAIGELITNAAHHSDDGAAITVSGSVTPKANGTPPTFSISVTDQGRGIPPAVMKQLFNLFYTTRPTGTGMGLPIVRRIVQQHNGTIEITSAIGAGTRVDVVLAGI